MRDLKIRVDILRTGKTGQRRADITCLTGIQSSKVLGCSVGKGSGAKRWRGRRELEEWKGSGDTWTH